MELVLLRYGPVDVRLQPLAALRGGELGLAQRVRADAGAEPGELSRRFVHARSVAWHPDSTLACLLASSPSTGEVAPEMRRKVVSVTRKPWAVGGALAALAAFAV